MGSALLLANMFSSERKLLPKISDRLCQCFMSLLLNYYLFIAAFVNIAFQEGLLLLTANAPKPFSAPTHPPESC